ncbi:hypothetical protein E8E12_001026 [Didymella heteroderae]|uniref:Phosphoglycerate mutase-like protein n=1 Tax=Didymella heteroderae TaxID=1769908 RepID=A0A9P5BW80_9PLEO|nr:hypothetical protein E8E12_001026 [Didymella heteroderae]
MSDRQALIPRVYILRHGETEWAKIGRFTGTTEVGLTEDGIAQVSLTAATLIGAGKLLDPCHLAHIFVSPRDRTRQTLELLLPSSSAEPTDNITYTESIAEWKYGDYEGQHESEIRESRAAKGLDSQRPWSIWRDGCEGGETAQQVCERLDKFIEEIKAIQQPYMCEQKPAEQKPADILVF